MAATDDARNVAYFNERPHGRVLNGAIKLSRFHAAPALALMHFVRMYEMRQRPCPFQNQRRTLGSEWPTKPASYGHSSLDLKDPVRACRNPVMQGAAAQRRQILRLFGSTDVRSCKRARSSLNFDRLTGTVLGSRPVNSAIALSPALRKLLIRSKLTRWLR
jgi:hypothetical protein